MLHALLQVREACCYENTVVTISWQMHLNDNSTLARIHIVTQLNWPLAKITVIYYVAIARLLVHHPLPFTALRLIPNLKHSSL